MIVAPIVSSWVGLFCSVCVFTESLRSWRLMWEGGWGVGAPWGLSPQTLSQAGIIHTTCGLGCPPFFFSLGILKPGECAS